MGDDKIKESKFQDAVINYSITIDEIVEQSNLHKILSSRSYANLKNGCVDAARADADACILLQPKWSQGYLRKGIVLFQYMTIIAYCDIGLAQLAQGDKNEARRTFERALVAFPYDEELLSARFEADKWHQPAGEKPPRAYAGCGYNAPSVSRMNVSPNRIRKNESVRLSTASSMSALTCFCDWLHNQPLQETKCSDLVRFYAAHPQHRNNVGKLKEFCAQSNGRLRYEVRSKIAYVVLVSSGA